MTSRANHQAGCAETVLSYKLKLFPNATKRWMLGALADHFAREHGESLERLARENHHPANEVPLKGLKLAGRGEFKQRATRRAVIDLKRQRRALASRNRRLSPWPVSLPRLTATLIDSAEVRRPRRATGFDLWVHVEGLARWCQVYVPAKLHAGITRTLALPGATLNKRTEIFARDGQWYARVSVTVPNRISQPTRGVLGADVGVRTAVATSDGRIAQSLHPVLRRSRDQLATRQREQQTRRTNGLSHQCQVLCKEARRFVTLAKATGRAVALEDPHRLIRWKQHAARFFGNRVQLLAGIAGVPVVLVAPPYTSRTCACCGSRESFRQGRCFHCYDCGHTAHADVNAARVIASRGTVAFRAARSVGASTSGLWRGDRG